MATKKPTPKAAPKKAAKAAPPKPVAPAKKATPAAKPAAKAAPAKKAAPVVAPKKAAAPVKKAAPAKVDKPVAKPVAKKAAPPAPAKKAVAPAKPEVAAKQAPKAVEPKVAPVQKSGKPLPKKGTKASREAALEKANKQIKAAKAAKSGRVETKRPVEAGPAPITAYKKPERKQQKEEVVKEVKVPKLTVKTSIPYTPGYTSLDKRVDNQKTQEPLVRYSDTELNEFRELINRKLEAAKKELAYLQGLITRKDDMSGDESDAKYATMEDGSLSMEREQLSQMASRQVDFIDKLEKAIVRIENKTYGICRVTGRLIDKNRLRAVPHATLSLEAKLGLVKPSAE
jgi:RNA polymerase-binding transcription factor DksA